MKIRRNVQTSISAYNVTQPLSPERGGFLWSSHSPRAESHPHTRANKTVGRFSVFEKNGRALPAFARGSGCDSAMGIVCGDAVGRFVNRPYNTVGRGEIHKQREQAPALRYHLSFVCRGRRPRRPQELRTDRGAVGDARPYKRIPASIAAHAVCFVEEI